MAMARTINGGRWQWHEQSMGDNGNCDGTTDGDDSDGTNDGWRWQWHEQSKGDDGNGDGTNNGWRWQWHERWGTIAMARTMARMMAMAIAMLILCIAFEHEKGGGAFG